MIRAHVAMLAVGQPSGAANFQSQIEKVSRGEVVVEPTVNVQIRGTSCYWFTLRNEEAE